MSTGGIIAIILVAFILILVILFLAAAIKIVPQSNAYVIERIGKYHVTWNTGIHFRFPVVDKIAKKISLKEQVVNFNPQTVITKDNVTMEIDTILFFQITDTKLYSYGVENPIFAIENLTSTTLRNVIGDLELDKTLTSRDVINGKLQVTLDEATNSWGIKVIRVEVKNIQPPREVKEAMEKQMRAEREKRAAILTAEGEKQSRILRAEGLSEATIKEAEGKARALIVEQEALAKSINLLNSNKPSKEALALRSLETIQHVANGNSTKIIIPAELQGISASFATLATIFDKDKNDEKIIDINKEEIINVKPIK